MKLQLNSLFQQSEKLLKQFDEIKQDWDSNKQKNELLVDISLPFITKNRKLGKYARKIVKNPKWTNSDEFKQLEQIFNSLKINIISTLNSCYSMTRRGLNGSSQNIISTFNRAINKVNLRSKILGSQKFLLKLKDEELIDKLTWENKRLNKSKSKGNKTNLFEQFLFEILQGSFPTLTPKILKIIQHPGENLWIEKKQEYKLTAQIHWIEFLKDVMSAVNSLALKPIGIIIGIIESTSEFIDAYLPDEAEIRQQIKSKIEPDIEFCIYALNFPNSKNGFIIVINPNNILHRFKRDLKINSRTVVNKGEVWVREGTRKYKLSVNEALDYAVKKSKLI
ncbi:MAG: hypothetical protein HeimC3_39420 [Candidatus Heimdallarchaeota archaeon LC_3]|nr:MAG: hypothetical protein HeimC3_39420 [Candidatus Heimdallarchaeota archaeon LC_3]